VAPLSGTHPFASPARMALLAARVDLLRHADRLPARDRATPGVLRDRRPRRSAEDPGESRGKGRDPRPDTGAHRPSPLGTPRRAGGRNVVAEPRSAPATPANRRCGQAAAGP